MSETRGEVGSRGWWWWAVVSSTQLAAGIVAYGKGSGDDIVEAIVMPFKAFSSLLSSSTSAPRLLAVQSKPHASTRSSVSQRITTYNQEKKIAFQKIEMDLKGKRKMNTHSPDHNSSEMTTVMQVAPQPTKRSFNIKIKIKTPGKSIEIVNLGENRSSSMDSHNQNNKPKDIGSEKDLKLDGTFHSCTMCPKVFTTKKKLYGHMRVHPDRTYRGMVPPKGHTTHPSAAKEDSAAIKEPSSRRKNVLPRGQKGSAHHSWADRMMDYENQINSGLNSVEFHPFCELDLMSDEDQAAVFLQMLSEGVNDNSITWTRARALVTGVNDYYVESTKRRKIEEDDDDNEDQEEAHDQKTRAYLCYTCNKSFPTPQALGGHRTSHTKAKNNFEDGEVLEKDKVISGQAEKHPCKQCDAVFPCGQALGGHMRKHFMEAHSQDIALLLTAPTTAIEPSVVNRQIRHVSDFDLNNEPMED
ncbi:hypothetical protein J5N97_029740 [Dioscorea zingiberensis]|uniref:C2H2-type domain-containing protein n=1 Tax=Dioscorea zingiberensis TaxID=325984 RepID=A0A9D5BVY0_9LILI|nr:hypothetical protein J5N97_029740 [Dioscorea zingiberensis]